MEQRSCPNCRLTRTGACANSTEYMDNEALRSVKRRAEVVDFEDWMRRFADFQLAQQAIHGSILPVPRTSPRDFLAEGKAKLFLMGMPVLLDYYPNDFMTDRCDFVSPGVKIVPPGTIKPEHEKCGVCWGLMTASDPEEACCGEGARMLPCGRIFGRKCLASTFQIGNEGQAQGRNRCPTCRKQFRVSLTRYSSPLSFWKASIKFFSEKISTTLRQGGRLALVLLIPFIYAVAISMDVGVKANVFSDH
jgi:hypothetical protein